MILHIYKLIIETKILCMIYLLLSSRLMFRGDVYRKDNEICRLKAELAAETSMLKDIENVCKRIYTEIEGLRIEIEHLKIKKRVMDSLNRGRQSRGCDEDIERVEDKIAHKNTEFYRYDELYRISKRKYDYLNEKLKQYK